MEKAVGIYSFGYWGWGPCIPALHNFYSKKNKENRGRGIKWIDTRISRAVRSEGFRGDNPRRLFGSRNYEWIPELGNRSIKTGGQRIVIDNFEKGFEILLQEIKRAQHTKRDLILFCSCHNKKFKRCHRTVLIRLLKRKRTRGVRVYGEHPLNAKFFKGQVCMMI